MLRLSPGKSGLGAYHQLRRLEKNAVDKKWKGKVLGRCGGACGTKSGADRERRLQRRRRLRESQGRRTPAPREFLVAAGTSERARAAREPHGRCRRAASHQTMLALASDEPLSGLCRVCAADGEPLTDIFDYHQRLRHKIQVCLRIIVSKRTKQNKCYYYSFHSPMMLI